MGVSWVGRVVDGQIELDGRLSELDGRRVGVTVEVLDEEEHPALRATRDAPPDERPYSAEERASVEQARSKGAYVTTSELRARLATQAKPT